MYRELLLPINLLIKPASQQPLKTKKFFKIRKKGCFIPQIALSFLSVSSFLKSKNAKTLLS